MSQKKMSEYIFTWKIKNFLSCFLSKGDCIQSPVFTVENLSDWFLLIYPYGYPEEFRERHDCLEGHENFIGLSLVWNPPKEVTEKFVVISFSIDMMDPMDNVFKSFKSDQNSVFTKEFRNRSVITTIDIDKLARKMENWEEDILTLKCRMKFSKLRNQINICGAETSTTIEIDRCNAEWDIKIPTLLKSTESIVFPLWNLYIFEIILTSTLEGLSISFNLKEKMPELVYPVKFKLSLYDTKGNKIISKRAEHLFSTADIWKFPDLLTKEF